MKPTNNTRDTPTPNVRKLGPFELHESLGTGGMGAVFRGFRLGPGGFRKQVAVKLVRPNQLNEVERWRKILLNEAYHGALLKHRNIVETFEVGEVDGAAYLSMEYIDGPNLSQMLKAHGRLPLPVVLNLGIQICSGLTHAHTVKQKGFSSPVVHCDLKPSNIIVDGEGGVHIIDLGVAVLEGKAPGVDGSLCGTVAYMSPHLVTGSPAGPWVDLFGLGAILFEAATGRRLLPGASAKDLIPQIIALPKTLETDCRLAPLGEISTPLADLVKELLLADGISGIQTAKDAQSRLVKIRGSKKIPKELGKLAASTPQCRQAVEATPTQDAIKDNATLSWDPATFVLPNHQDRPLGMVATMDKTTQVSLEIGRVDLEHGILQPANTNSTTPVLSPIESKLLAHFARQPGEVLSQDELLREVWGYHPDSTTRTVFTTISRLRGKIERDPQIPRHLVTVPRRGYCFRPLALTNEADCADTDTVDLPARVEPEPSSKPATNLVLKNDAFIGREAEMATLLNELAPGRLICLKGTGGIGKTRLAQEAGLKVLGLWTGGAWFCSLSEARTSEAVTRRVAASLGIVCGNTPVADLPEFLGNAIAARSDILVILDNGEQVVEVLSELVNTWRVLAPSICFILTSREPLRVTNETVIELEPLPTKDAVELLIQRAAHATPPRELTPNPLLVEIVERIDRLPLAIELVAGRLRLLNPTAILDHLKKRFQLLRTRRRDRSDRHVALHATIDWSWQLLKPWVQSTLAQLCVFKGGFDYAAAAAVVDLSSWEDDAFLLDVIGDLIDKSLLQTRTIDGATRLGMYQSVHDFAEAHLSKTEGTGQSWGPNAVAFRHAQFQARRGTSDSIRALNHQGGCEIRRALALELPNLLAASERAWSEGDVDTSALCAIAAFEVLLIRGPFDMAQRISEEILSSPDLAPEARSRLLYSHAELARLSGHHDSAMTGFEEVRSTAVELNDVILAARADAQIASILSGTTRDDEARALLNGAIQTARDCDDTRTLGFFLCRLGMSSLTMGLVPDAKATLLSSLEASRAAGDRWTEGVTLHALAYCDMVDGQLDQAKTRCEAAILAYREVGSRRDEATVYGALGQVAQGQQNVEGAREAFAQAVSLCGQIGHSVALGVFLGMLGELEGQEGNADEARGYLERGAVVLRRTEEVQELARLLCRRGMTEINLRDPASAAAALTEADRVTEATPINESSDLGQALCKLREAISNSTPEQSG